jgi:hypothetical protein
MSKGDNYAYSPIAPDPTCTFPFALHWIFYLPFFIMITFNTLLFSLLCIPIGGLICQVTPQKMQEKQFLIFYEVHDQKSNI